MDRREIKALLSHPSITTEEQAKAFLDKTLSKVRKVVNEYGWDLDRFVCSGSVVKNFDDGIWEINIQCQILGKESEAEQTDKMLGKPTLGDLVFNAVWGLS